jgi:hypothetical protein
MSRSRIWLISTAAVLCTAVPALAYSWPALFGVPGAFGQEASQPPQVAATPRRSAYTSTRPAAAIATATSSYAEARPGGGFEEAEECQARCPAAQIGSCPLSLNVLVPAVQMPLLPPGVHLCPEGQQPLFIRHFAPSCEGKAPCEANGYTATRCGDGVAYVKDCVVECCADEAKGCCAKCAKDCKCCCTKADKTKTRTASRSHSPATIVIVHEPAHAYVQAPVPVQVPVPHVVPLPPPPVMQPVFSYAPAFPPVPVSVPMASCPTVSRPVPAADQTTHQFAIDEIMVQRGPECDAAAPGSHVRILQRGGMCFVSSPNFEIRCDRVQSRDSDRLVLEGNVTLVSRRHGQTMTIEAERITLNVSTDQFQIDNARGLEQTRFNVAPLGGPAATPVAAPSACPPAGFYGTTSAEESNVPSDDPRMARVRMLMEARKAACQAHEAALSARWKEVDSGKVRPTDYLLDSISRFLNAKQKESEILQEYETLCEEIRRGVVVNERNFSAPAPAAVPFGRHTYEVPPVTAPSPR